MYIYPDNLKSKATLWLWELRDIGIIGVGCLISVFAFPAGLAAAHRPDGGLCFFIHPLRGCEYPRFYPLCRRLLWKAADL